jgi:Domain of unknown function (DUF4278)
MKLTYRGSAYEIPASIQLGSDSMDQPKIKLIYRGHIYYITPCSVVVPEAVKTDEPTVTLVYRGSIYERKPQCSKFHPNLRATN